MRSPALAFAMAGAVLASACTTSHLPSAAPEPLEPSFRGVEPGWVKVEVPGEIRVMDGVYTRRIAVVGEDPRGGPLVAAIDEDTVTHVAQRVPNHYFNGISGVTGDFENDGIVEQADPINGVPALVYTGWIGDPGGFGFGLPEDEKWYVNRLYDEQGRPAVWASLLFDDEGDLRVVGVVRRSEEWVVRLWEKHPTADGWVLTDRGTPPILGDAPSVGSPSTSTEEVLVLVAGQDRSGAARLWGLPSSPYSRSPWARIALSGGADTITDILSWAVGSWVSGARDGRAVVWDVGEPGQPEVDLPEIELDPDNPRVLLLRLDVTSQPVIATQTREGPSVWIRTRSGWREQHAPAGRMTLAAASETGIYLLIDGQLWYRSLAWDEQLP